MSKKYELVNNRPAPIVINFIKTVLRPSGQALGKVIVSEEQLDNEEIQFLLERDMISVLKHTPEKRTVEKQSKKSPAPQPTSNEEGVVVVMDGKIPVRKRMSNDTTRDGADLFVVAGEQPETETAATTFTPDVIDPDDNTTA